MAISFDTTTAYSNSLGNIGGGNPATATWSHTCTGSNGYLAVVLGAQGGTSSTFLGVTYNGVAMTQITTQGDITVYEMFNPPTGAHNIVASINDTGFLPFGGMASSYAGVASSIDSSNTATKSLSSTFGPTTTVVASNAWLVAIASTINVNTIIGVGSGTTRRNYVDNNGNVASYALADSNGTVSTGSQALNFTSGGSANWNGIILSLKPFIPITATPSFLLKMI